MTTGPSAPRVGESATSGSGRQFRLLERVGRGSFGEVYLAEQRSGAGFRRKVVLEILNDDVANLRSAARRMRDEARVLGLLSHRHIVAVHDLVRIEDHDGLLRTASLMDWVPGADLERVLAALAAVRGVFPARAALEIGAAILDALDFAFDADDGAGGRLSVIHRDIKPSNVRLGPDGDVKVLDFGVARFSHACREAETRASAWIGTERYMAPERLLREGDTEAGDVYAATSTVVELILGEPIGRTPITPELHQPWVDGILARVRPRIDADAHGVSRVLTALGRGLRADPELRPMARELSRELEGLSRRVRGPTCREFAREIVPRIDGLLGAGPVPASGTWVERPAAIELQPEPPPPSPQPSPQPGPSVVREPIGPPPLAVLQSISVVEESFFLDPVPVRAARPGRYGWFTTVVLVNGAVSCAVGAVLLGGAVAFGDDPWSWIPAEVTVRASELAATNLAGLPLPSVWPETVLTVADATALAVRCGDVSASGTTSVPLSEVPAGPCTVEATVGGDTVRTEVRLDGATAVACAVAEGVLGCRAD